MFNVPSTTLSGVFAAIVLGVLVLLSCFSSSLSAVELNLKGFVDTYHAVRAKAPNDFLSSRTRLRLEALSTLDEGRASAFVSFNLQHNNILPDKTGFELREAYVEYVSDKWDLRVGRQIIVWGKADGMQITDLISPLDLTEFLARDYDDIRTPVEALKFRLLGEKTNFELVWVPIFKPAALPEGDNPWSLTNDAFELACPNSHVIVHDPMKPAKKLGNSELFSKFSLYLSGIDLAFSAFYTWDDFGVSFWDLYSQDGHEYLETHYQYHRVGGFGAEFSLPLGQVVLRGESAFYIGKRFQPAEANISPIKKNAVDSLLGLDWYPGNDWTVSVQLVDKIILDHQYGIHNDAHTGLMTFHLGKKLMRETLNFSNMLYLGFNDLDLFNRFMVDYALTDGLHLMFGFDLFLGNSGDFGQYKDNSEFFIKAKYSF
jgi:hypothetical protein